MPVKDKFDQMWFQRGPVGDAIVLGGDQINQKIIGGVWHRQFLCKGGMPCRTIAQPPSRLGDLYLTEIIRLVKRFCGARLPILAAYE